MSELQYAHLRQRGLISVSGPDAHSFLQNLVTTDMDGVDAAGCGAAALLTPQGKILFDFLIYQTDAGYLVDTHIAAADELLKRLSFYKLRAKVEITAAPALAVFALWGAASETLEAPQRWTDPRLPALGLRIVGDATETARNLDGLGVKAQPDSVYHAHRIRLGIPEGIEDYDFRDIFPHDADLDQLGAVSFTKGCYVGQEVVARMEHRSTARKRFVRLLIAGQPAPKGADIVAGDRSVGVIGSSVFSGTTGEGLALVRLDKVRQAQENGVPLLCDGTPVTVELPEWAAFNWPAQSDSD